MSSDKRELFKGAAQYYSQYRKGYPKELFSYLVGEFKLNKSSRVLDLGTGTGQIAIPLSKYVKEVVAVDPEQEMLEEGKRVADKARANNVKWVDLRAEDISDELGTFDLTTMGASFHWMDRERVLEKVYEVTNDGGHVVIVSDFRGGTAPGHGEGWKKVRKDLVAKYLGERRRAGNTFFDPGNDKFEDRLTDSPFGGYKEWNYSFIRTWTLDEVINFLYSTSFASERFFGDRLAEFEEELKTELLSLEPSGLFREEVRLQALIGEKKSIS